VHDLVIRNGTLVDGGGGPAQPPGRGDVAVDGDRITAVGTVEGRGRREVDAEGHLVTPGFVDIHTHYDGQATWDPEVTPSSWHGVTTIVMGNCGVGFAPADPARRDWLIQLMEGVEDIPGTALAEGMTWNWETFPEYLDELERMRRVLDVAALVPHGAVRAYVMGERGARNEEATADDIARMGALVREAVAAGAAGFSTTRTLLHRAKDGELAAGTTASADELIGIGLAMGETGRGVFEVASDMFDPEGEFAWMATVSRETGRPVTFGCLQNDLAPEQWRHLLKLTGEANTAGASIVPQVAGRPACVLFGFESTAHPFLFHRAYQEVAALPFAERIARLRTPEVRDAILGERPDVQGIAAFLTSSWHKLFLLGDPPEYEPGPERSVAAIAAREGRPPEAVAYDLMLEDDGHALLYIPLLGYSHGDFGALHEMLTHPGTVLGLGDGGAHCGLLCDASLPTYMLSHWARDRERGDRLAVEQAVHLQTRRTAELYGFADRGLVAPGLKADLNVLDFEGLAIEPPEMAYDLPAGGRRLVQRSRGYRATIKSGVVVRQDDAPTGARPGTLLRGPQPA
jgi:N-acyl-D-aspartate/D-glutamate deacylase